MDEKDFQKFKDEIKKRTEEQNFYITETIKEQKEKLDSIKKDLSEHSDNEISKKLSRIDEMYDIFARVKENIDAKVKEMKDFVNQEDIKLSKVEQGLLNEINKFKEAETKKTSDANQKFVGISDSLNKISFSLDSVKKENAGLRTKIKKEVSKELSKLDRFSEKQAQFMAMLEKLKASQESIQNVGDVKLTQTKGQIEVLAQAQNQLGELTERQKELINSLKNEFEKQLEEVKEYAEKNIEAKTGRLSYEFLAKFSEFAKLRDEFHSNLKDVKASLEKNIYEKKETLSKDMNLLSKNLVGMSKELDELSNSLSDLKNKMSRMEVGGKGGAELRTVLLDQTNEKISSLSKELNSIKTELSSTVQRSSPELKQKIKSLSQRTAGLSKKIFTINDALKKIEALKEKYTASNLKKFDKKVKEILAQNKNLSTKLNKFVTIEELNKKLKDINENAAKISSLRNSLILKGRKGNVSKELLLIKKSFAGQINFVRNEVLKIEKQNKIKQPDVNKKIDDITLAVLNTQKEINRLKAKRLPKIKNSEVTRLKETITKLNKKIESLPKKQKITTTTGLKLRNLLASINGMHSEVSKIKENCVSASDFENLVSGFKNKLNDVSNEISKVSASTENLKTVSNKIKGLEDKYAVQNKEINTKIKSLQEGFNPIVEKYRFKQVADMRDKLSELTDCVNTLSSNFKEQVNSLKSDLSKEELLVDKKLEKIESSTKKRKLKEGIGKELLKKLK